jgi:hypothetical protein
MLEYPIARAFIDARITRIAGDDGARADQPSGLRPA